MTFSGQVSKPLRVLVSEGNSTSAREAVTILGLSGHLAEICDPSPYCLARFSRFVRKFHRCPGMRDDPGGFLTFVERLLARRHFDVLLPIHEQGFLFARVHARLADRVGLALPSFADYRSLHNKAGLSRLLGDLHLPQPATHIVSSENEARAAARFPCVVKTSVGTASQGIWFVHNDGDLNEALRELSARGSFEDEVLVQEFIFGATEKTQAVFCRGKLVGSHAYRQLAAGIGGGDAIKESVDRPQVRSALAMIGEKLAWHGALSLDYVMPENDNEKQGSSGFRVTDRRRSHQEESPPVEAPTAEAAPVSETPAPEAAKVPRPPEIAVPPTTTAAITWSSRPVPALGSISTNRTAFRRAASPARAPMITKTLKTTRRGRIAASRAASGSEPVA